MTAGFPSFESFVAAYTVELSLGKVDRSTVPAVLNYSSMCCQTTVTQNKKHV